MFRVGLPCYLGLNSCRSVSINVDKTRKHFPEKLMAHVSPMFAVSYTGNIVSSVSFCFQDTNYCFRYTAGKFNENPSMRALAKFLRARASEHSSNFCEQFEQRPNFASTFELDGTIRHPSFCLAANEVNGKRKKETQWIAKIGSRLAAPARKLAH